MKLIVAEKASVAGNIAAALGAEKRGIYWQSAEYIITNCVGHLCALAMPEDYDPRYKRWALEDLPIIPSHYRYRVESRTRRQYELVSSLMNSEHVDSIINACDGDREGEHIFRLVYHMAQCRKKVQRLWVSSMEEAAILEGMKHLRPMSEYDRLAEAARCREIADWLVGINGSRIFSRLYNLRLIVGRVQTPTVGLIVQREKEIQDFKPQDYWVVTADLGDFTASRRCESKEELKKVLKACSGAQAAVNKIEHKNHKEEPPMLYNLNELQQECNSLFGATPAQTLDALQGLYEHRLATYPRTESHFLTEQDEESAEGVLNALVAAEFLNDISLNREDFHLDRLICEEKVSGHPALLPTLDALRSPEQNTLEHQILLLLLYRLLMASAPAREYDTTEVELLIGGYPFHASGTVEKSRGWRAVEDAMLEALGISAKRRSAVNLPDLDSTDTWSVQKASSKARQTKPPQRYTEGSLLAEMERLKLGTPATRAGILENIIQSKHNPNGLVTRGTNAGGKSTDTRHLYPTKNAFAFLDLLPEVIKTPEMTSQWEQELSDICFGSGTGGEFETSVEEFVRTLIRNAKLGREHHSVEFERPKDAKTICDCPICGKGKVISSRHRGEGTAKIVFHCTDAACPMRLSSPLAGRRITEDEVKQLCRDGITPWLEGFVSRQGKSFPTKLKIFSDGTTPVVRMTSLDDLAVCSCPVCGTGKIVPFHWRQSEDTVYEGWQCSGRECPMQRFYNPKYGRLFSEDEVKQFFTEGQIAVPSGMVDRSGNPFAAMVCLEKDEDGRPTGKIVTKKIKRRT